MAERQTQKTQNLPTARSWGFDPPLRHQSQNTDNKGCSLHSVDEDLYITIGSIRGALQCLQKLVIVMNELKDYLLGLGASLVGFACVVGLYDDVDAQSRDIELPRYPGAVSIALAIPKEIVLGINDGPTMDYYNAYYALNKKLDFLAISCGEYLRGRGYNAYPQTVSSVKEFGNYRSLLPHKTAAVNSGLGWIGKSALLVTPEYGSAVRLSSVLTDASLPYGAPIRKSNCGGCMECKDACPGKAISGRLWSPESFRDEFFDVKTCRKKARELAASRLGKEITLCGKCMEVCPYTQKYLKKT